MNSQAPLPDNGDYLTTKEAAAYLKLSPQHMEKWRVSGSGPAYLKLAGRIVRYRRDELDAWASTRKKNHTSEDAAR